MLAGDILSLFMMFVSERAKFIVLIAAAVLFYVICDPYERRKKK